MDGVGDRVSARQRGQGGHPARSLVSLMLALLVAGCWSEEQPVVTDGQAQDDAAPVIQTTAEQVNRARKRDPLRRFAMLFEPSETAPQFRPVTRPVPSREMREERPSLQHFYAALADLDSGVRREPVTVLHLGDSHIASDRFTGDLRSMLQERFGDAGRGLMMPGFPFPYYRARGVQFAKGGRWTSASSLVDDPGPYGLTGVRLTTGDANASLRLTSEAGAFEWAEVTFLVGPRQGTAQVSVDDAAVKTVDTKAATVSVKTVRLRYKGTHLTVRAKGGGNISVLSWAVGQDKPGLRYVNLGIPSATASITRRWDDKIISADLARLKPDLIVLGYGTNEGFNDGLDIAAYEREVSNLIERLQRSAPEASFVVIGPADGARYPRFARNGRDMKTFKGADCRPLDVRETRDYLQLVSKGDARLARWHPPPNLGRVRSALRRVAARAGAHFWDWSAVMGGACGIHDWATAEPTLATSDHVHITAEGSQRSAEVFFAELMAGFEAQSKVASR